MFVYYVPAASYPPATDIMKEAFGGENVPYRISCIENSPKRCCYIPLALLMC